ncbi:uncharacterized protein A4U43_C02F21720 [Asparagus officinalis]|uniref:Membrane-associated kinase regulator 1 n=1 Tax=Asparagus officinalis TaxID=4686 RepID=A0A5P1FP21_ASPOF|nr:probable membrane-associated kinase regulator 1 [Asparagus officinalis]ONK78719.1 uncharacterized protein A4U43_C02F21720 [Asparagus officinalis]
MEEEEAPLQPPSSSSDFESPVSSSPSSRRSSTHLCPADELFYKGQLLPLHLSPRISMVRTLLLSSSSTSSSSTDTNTTASRDSNGSSSSSSSSSGVPAELLLLLPECDSSRPSSVTEEEARRAVPSSATKRNRYFASFANRFSSVFLNRGGSKKDFASAADMDLDYQIPAPPPTPPGKRVNATAKEVIKKYVKKVKPLYERLSPLQKNQSQSHNLTQHQKKKTFSFSIRRQRDVNITNCNIVESLKKLDEEEDGEAAMRGVYPHHAHSSSFSGNLRFPRRKKCAGSCPSSMRSSPTHSGLLRLGGGGPGGFPTDPSAGLVSSSSSSSMEELQSAIQGAIAHCKNTMLQSHQKKSLSIDAAPAN